jgi:hypothetical protein
LLLLVPLGETMSAGSGTDSPAGVRLGTLVIDSEGASAMLTLVGVQEMVLAVWMVGRGFRPAVLPTPKPVSGTPGAMS